EPYVAVVPHGHPFTREPHPLDPDLLSEHTLVIIGRSDTGIDEDIAAVLARWHLSPSVPPWQTEQPQTLANLVKAGLGVGVINAFAMEVSNTNGLATIQVGNV